MQTLSPFPQNSHLIAFLYDTTLTISTQVGLLNQALQQLFFVCRLLVFISLVRVFLVTGSRRYNLCPRIRIIYIIMSCELATKQRRVILFIPGLPRSAALTLGVSPITPRLTVFLFPRARRTSTPRTQCSQGRILAQDKRLTTLLFRKHVRGTNLYHGNKNDDCGVDR